MSEQNLDVSPIFEPIKIGNVTIKNRVAMAPMNMNYTGPNGYVSEQQMAYYAARAVGGTGLIITEALMGTDHPTADTYKKYNNAKIYNELYVPQMSELVEHVHAFGAKIFAQVAIGPGRQGTSEAGAVQPVSASPIPYKTYPQHRTKGMDPISLMRACGYQGEIPEVTDPEELINFANKVPGTHMSGETPREITAEEIAQIVHDIGVSAKLCKRCGFDGIEIHAPHGYLLHTFFAIRSNKRTDQYGGTFENRIRFVLECLESCRKFTGPDFVVGVRISASDEVPEGLTVQDMKRIAKRLEEEGADFIHLSDGSYEKMNDFLPIKEGQVIEKAAVIKEGLNIPLICPSVHEPHNAVDVLVNDKADMISQGRQQIADPEWVNKVEGGNFDEIVQCDRCNLACIGRFILALPCRCTLNKEVGYEHQMPKYMERPLYIFKRRKWQIVQQVGKEPSTPIAGIQPEDLK